MSLSNEELLQLLELSKQATPRSWHLRHLDDSHFMNLRAISTVPDTGKCEAWPEFKNSAIVAATLIQEPRYVNIADKKWDENAKYIIAAANLVPELVQEILDFRGKLRKTI